MHSRRALLRACGAAGVGAAAALLSACGASSAATTNTLPTAASSSAASSPSRASAATSSVAASATGSTAPASPSSSQAAQPAAAPGELTFWMMGDNTDQHYQAWTQRIKDFITANPKTPVQLVTGTYAGVNQKLPAVVAAGTPPNVSEQDRYTVAAGAAQGLMQDISGRASAAGLTGADQQPWAWQEVSIQGKLYGLPAETDSRMIFVNVTHLQQAGLPTTAPKTLDEYVQVASQLNKKSGDTYQQLGFIPWYDNWGMYGWGWLFGGDFYDAKNNRATLDDPKILASLEWLLGQAQKIGYQPVQDFVKIHSAQGNLFTEQVLSTYYQASASIKTYMKTQGLEWAAWAPPPPQGMDHTSTWSGGFCVVLPSGAKNPDASFELMRYLTDAKAQLLEAQTGLSMPTIKSVAADPFWKTVDPRVKQFVDMLPFSHSRPAVKQINIMTKELGDARDLVLQGKKTPAEALQEANQRVNLAIQENRAS